MKIELKNVKHSEFASQETNCFEATIYVDGKRAGSARNDGHGGPTFIHPRELAQRLDAYGATLPHTVTQFTGDDGKPFTYAQNAESIIDELLTAFLITRDVKRLLKAHILFVSAKNGKVCQTKKLRPEHLTHHLLDEERIKRQLDATRILNTVPVEEIVALMRSEAA